MKQHSPAISLLACAILLSLMLSVLSSCQQGCQHPFLTDQVISPSCDQEGKVLHTCTSCGYEYATDITPPTGHQLQEVTVASTCEQEGYTAYHCTTCGYSYQADHVPPQGHTLSSTEIPASCENAGYALHTCERCDYQYSDSHTPPVHDLISTLVYPTCTHSGYTHHQCQSCTYNYKSYLHYSELLPDAYTQNTTVLAKGIDVSKYNHPTDDSGNYLPLDWEAIKNAGFDYVILKIGSTPRNNGSMGGLEPTFEMDYTGAKAAGLDVGVYFFTYASSIEQNIADAELVAEWLKDKQLEYPIYYDIENHSFDENPYDNIAPTLPSKKTLTDFCVAFISRLQEKGFYCGLYCNRDWLENNLETARCTTLFDIWYARYRDIETPYDVTDVFTWSYGDQFGMWQYACTGVIDGFTNIRFDFNYAYKDFPTIIKDFHLNGY